MKNQRRITILIGLGILLAGLGVCIFLPREPSYEGKSLSEWLKDFDKAPQNLASGTTNALDRGPLGTRLGPGPLSLAIPSSAWQQEPIYLQITSTATVVKAVRQMGAKALPRLVQMV